MGRVDRAPPVLHVSTEVSRRELVLALLQTRSVDTLKEEADHRVVADSVHEVVDDGAQARLAAKLLEEGRMGHWGET